MMTCIERQQGRSVIEHMTVVIVEHSNKSVWVHLQLMMQQGAVMYHDREKCVGSLG